MAQNETAPGIGGEGGNADARRSSETRMPEASGIVNRSYMGVRLTGPPPSEPYAPVVPGVLGESPKTPDTTEPGSLGGIRLLVEAMRSRLAIDDDSHIWVAGACALSKYLLSPPLWIMVVGSPSSGKTEIIDVLADVSDYQIKKLTEPALLSWGRQKTIKYTDGSGQQKTRKESHPVGILVTLGNRSSLVTFTDYSTVLAMADHGRRDDLFAALRTIYDGEYSRDQGNREQALTWFGRLTFLAACTQAIDRFSAHNSQLGDRWLYVRTPELDQAQERAMRKQAMRNSSQDERYLTAVREFAKQTIEDAAHRLASTEVPDAVMDGIDEVAALTCLGRAGVPRERNDITGYPIIEKPPRMIKQLMSLAQCLLALDAGEARTIALCRRVALDSMPEERRRVLEELARHGLEGVNISNVAKLAKLDWKATKRVLEDLAAIGLAESYTESDGVYWDLAPEYADMVKSLLGR